MNWEKLQHYLNYYTKKYFGKSSYAYIEEGAINFDDESETPIINTYTVKGRIGYYFKSDINKPIQYNFNTTIYCNINTNLKSIAYHIVFTIIEKEEI